MASPSTGSLAHECRRPGGKRLLIVVAVAVYVALGVPVWWYTTLIPRPPLPHVDMQSMDLALNSSMLWPPVSVHVYVVDPGPEVDAAWLAHVTHQALSKTQQPDGPPIQQVSVIIESGSGCQYTSMTPMHSMSPPILPGQGPMQPPQPWSMPCLHLSTTTITSHAQDRTTHPAWHQLEPEDVDMRLHERLRQHDASHPGHFVFFVLPGTPTGQRSQPVVVVGQHRHAFMWQAGGAHACEGVEECIVQLAAPALMHMVMQQPGAVAVQRAKQLPTSPAADTILQFTLANGVDPPHTSPQQTPTTQFPTTFLSWEFDEFCAMYLNPLVKALALVIHLHVESQVRLHVVSGVTPRWSTKHQAYVLRAKKLPLFVASDWSLDFGLDAGPARAPGAGTGDARSHGSGRTPACAWADQGNLGQGVISGGVENGGDWQGHTLAHVLHMVLYVPPPSQQPLYLLRPSGEPSTTHSFSIPSWGAVHVLTTHRTNTSGATDASALSETAGTGAPTEATTLRIDGEDGSNKQPHVSGSAVSRQERVLGEDDLHVFAQTVVAQLRVLRGLPELPQEGFPGTAGVVGINNRAPPVQVLPGDVGVSTWEVDSLARARAASNIREAARMLGSFSRLATALPNLEMPDEIGGHVATSLAALKNAVGAVQAGRHDDAVTAAQTAMAAAEAAFSHPAVLAQLSFPESHKVGVYVPFFVPALTPVILALLREIKQAHNRWRAYRKHSCDAQSAATGVPNNLSVEELDQLHMMRAKIAKHGMLGSTPAT